MKRVAVVTPSYHRDLAWTRTLNASVLEFFPQTVKHYLVIDRRDLPLFRPLQNARTIVHTVEDVAPGGFFRVPFLKKRWMLRAPVLPILGWLVQQVAKIAMASVLDEDIMVMVDSDVSFIRNVDLAMFSSPEGIARLYRRPGGILPSQANFIRWHENDCKLLGVAPDTAPMDDYVGNMISWDRKIALQMCARVESVTGEPWYVAFAKARGASEYLLYGNFVEKVIGVAGNAWIDNRSWCHTHWGRSPLDEASVRDFAQQLRVGDVAISIAGYSGTSDELRRIAVDLVRDPAFAPSTRPFDPLNDFDFRESAQR
jgi:hypothetical protein